MQGTGSSGVSYVALRDATGSRRSRSELAEISAPEKYAVLHGLSM
jgi:hypothetical protein